MRDNLHPLFYTMTIIDKPIEELRPYRKNPRINDDAVKYVAESIRRFGFKVPVVIDSSNVIVAGHTRLKAAKQLGMDTIPCVVADDLSPEEIRAFRLADNKVAEKSKWDADLLTEELEGITDIDMSAFDFDIPGEEETEEEDDEPGENERQRTADAYNLDSYDEKRTAGFYQMPVLKRCTFVPDELIGFNYAKTSERKNVGIHFFIDDYQFERVWNAPMDYIDQLSEYDCVLTPDFSLYMDMPIAMKIWNVYRSRLIGQMMQDSGIRVIPTLSWAEPQTYQFCFDGLPSGGTVAVSTVGVMRDKSARAIWADGMTEAIKRLKPKNIICYGSKLDFDFGKINVKYIEARKFK